MLQTISPNIIHRRIIAESVNDIYFLHANQSHPTCEGVFLPPGHDLRVLIHVPRDH